MIHRFYRQITWAMLVTAGAASACAEKIDAVGPAGPVKKVHTGFQFTEGPAADRQGNLYFTDIPAEKIHRLSPDGKLSTFTDKSRHANGLMVNDAGELFACEMDGQIAAWDLETGKRRVACATHDGKRFNACNDLVLDRAGGLYFTDPHFRAPKPLPQGTMGVYYVNAQGEAQRLIDDLPAPNGVILSPDEKTLYVCPSGQAEMMAYQVEAPGKIGPGRVLCKLKQPEGQSDTGADGLTVDTQGNLYITSRLGVQVVTPQGKILGIIALPEVPANVTFGGPENKTLYATARTSLYAVPMESTGYVFPGKKK